MYFTKLANLMLVSIYFVLGNEVISGDADSDFIINAKDITTCLENFPELKKHDLCY